VVLRVWVAGSQGNGFASKGWTFSFGAQTRVRKYFASGVFRLHQKRNFPEMGAGGQSAAALGGDWSPQ
jgi:hypothetical protein